MADQVVLRLLEAIAPHLREPVDVDELIREQRDRAASSMARLPKRVGGYEPWVYAENALDDLLIAAALRLAEHVIRRGHCIGEVPDEMFAEYERIRDAYSEYQAQQENYAMMKADEQAAGA